MNDQSASLDERYTIGLSKHLEGASEASLTTAYELGREAMTKGTGVLELAGIHHRALRRLAVAGPLSAQQDRFDKAAAYFAESLSSFEMSLRGYRDTNEHLLSLNEELKQAKAAVEAANRELEAFSYSVAHDLRAPLRGIDGFSQALLEDHADKLDDEGRQHLQFVRESTQQMAQLIDDLLALSRVARSEMRRERVDLSEMARAIILRLRRTQPDRAVDVQVADGLEAEGDAGLLKAALENLLGNAWKFTSREPSAQIEIGMTTAGGSAPFYVRDNGAGFDMAYAGKLFGVFQRLHSTHEFEGTGVGLATVQRIIARHGGRVWAEGEVGKGAIFYFTLGA